MSDTQTQIVRQSQMSSALTFLKEGGYKMTGKNIVGLNMAFVKYIQSGDYSLIMEVEAKLER